MTRGALAVGLLATAPIGALVAADPAAPGDEPGVPPIAVQADDRIHTVLPRDAIPAIDEPRFESVEAADAHLADEELVIGLVGDTEQRAYSTWQLDRHEIVNDVFEGRPIAATW